MFRRRSKYLLQTAKGDWRPLSTAIESFPMERSVENVFQAGNYVACEKVKNIKEGRIDEKN